MSSMSALNSRLDGTLARADDILAAKLRREKDRLEREIAEEQEAARDQARADAWRNREIGAFYDDAFRSFGVETPPPVDDERPGNYRHRLYERLRRKLPNHHSLADVRGDELHGVAFVNFEKMLLEAAKAEGERPSVENMPDDGTIVMRVRSDANTGGKYNEFWGKTSFIKEMGRPGRKVAAIIDRRTGQAIWGRPFPAAR
jgi:hypothetical protein